MEYMKEYAPTPMIRGHHYSGYYVPMYRIPFRSEPVHAILEDGTEVIAAWNGFSNRWIIDATDEVITQKVVEWWG